MHTLQPLIPGLHQPGQHTEGANQHLSRRQRNPEQNLKTSITADRLATVEKRVPTLTGETGMGAFTTLMPGKRFTRALLFDRAVCVVTLDDRQLQYRIGAVAISHPGEP